MATKTATPWGPAELVEELTVRQQAGERRFASIVQLLETSNGERLIRFAYSTDGTARRGPVTFRQRDVERLRAGLAKRPELAEARWGYRRASARSRAASTSEASRSAPSADPSSGSTACSGWGMSPIMLPRSLQMPAMSSTDPLHGSP
jgi:hypothetical protein